MLPEVNIRDALIQLFISDPIPVLSKQTLLLTVRLSNPTCHCFAVNVLYNKYAAKKREVIASKNQALCPSSQVWSWVHCYFVACTLPVSFMMHYLLPATHTLLLIYCVVNWISYRWAVVKYPIELCFTNNWSYLLCELIKLKLAGVQL